MTIEEVTEGSTGIKTPKALLWLGIVSIIMLFAGLTSAYIIRQAKGEWLKFELPSHFYLSTFLILLSSLTMFWAVSSAKKDNFKAVTSGIGITFILGIAFVICQFYGWNSMIENGIYFTGPGSNVSASFLYVLTSLHAAHALGGIISLLVTFINSLKKSYNSKKNIRFATLFNLLAFFRRTLDVFIFIFALYQVI